MTTAEMQEKIKLIIEKEFGVSTFAVLKEAEGFSLVKFILDDNLCKTVKDMFTEIFQNQFLCDEAELDKAENIDDNRHVFYEILQNEDYNPFGFLSTYSDVTISYSEACLNQLMGFAFRFNVNDNYIWIYQQINYPQLINKSKNVYAILSGLSGNPIYSQLDKDILKIERKIDFLIIGNSIITYQIKLLQRCFQFETYVRNEAKKTVDIISEMDIVDGLDRFVALGDQKSLTNARKLVKAKNSPVLRMNKATLIQKLDTLPRYKGKFEIKDEKIVVNNQKQAIEFIKMLNDSILKSELTDAEYDSTVKTELEPLKQA